MLGLVREFDYQKKKKRGIKAVDWDRLGTGEFYILKVPVISNFGLAFHKSTMMN